MSMRTIDPVHWIRCLLFAGSTVALGVAPVIAQECGWHQVEVAGPPARHSHAMVYDSARKTTVLFGGWDGACLADTWEYRCPQETPPREIPAELTG